MQKGNKHLLNFPMSQTSLSHKAHEQEIQVHCNEHTRLPMNMSLPMDMSSYDYMPLDHVS